MCSRPRYRSRWHSALTSILLGQNALERESFHKHANRATRQSARMGVGAVDVALWDLAGKYFDAPIYRLLGGHRTRLPAYASTWIADRNQGGLATPQEFADFAEECLNMGYKGFKIHPWPKINIPEEIETINQVGKRVAGKMDLMTDPACAYDTFADAVKVGRACDEWNFYWYEDPFKDGGVSQFAHKKLRQLIKTPLLQCEHIRGLEQHVDFIVAEATDFVRGDIWYDGGITGSIKLARACEGFGLDVEFHAGGPAERQTMAAIHNSNYYEAGLVHPREPRSNYPSTSLTTKTAWPASGRTAVLKCRMGQVLASNMTGTTSHSTRSRPGNLSRRGCSFRSCETGEPCIATTWRRRVVPHQYPVAALTGSSYLGVSFGFISDVLGACFRDTQGSEDRPWMYRYGPQIMNLLKDLQDGYDVSYLVIAHHLATVRYMCHRVPVMYPGKIVEVAPVQELYNTRCTPTLRL